MSSAIILDTKNVGFLQTILINTPRGYDHVKCFNTLLGEHRGLHFIFTTSVSISFININLPQFRVPIGTEKLKPPIRPIFNTPI